MRKQERNELAEALLTLLEGASAAMPSPVSGTDAGSIGQRRGRRPRAFGAAPAPDGRSGQTVPEGSAAVGQRGPAPAEGEGPWDGPGFAPVTELQIPAEDAMETIDSFFRRDSRRYDGGFSAR